MATRAVGRLGVVSRQTLDLELDLQMRSLGCEDY